MHCRRKFDNQRNAILIFLAVLGGILLALLIGLGWILLRLVILIALSAIACLLFRCVFRR